MDLWPLGTRVWLPKAPRVYYCYRAGWEAPPPKGTIIPFRDGSLSWVYEGVTYQRVRWDKPNFLNEQPKRPEDLRLVEHEDLR